MKKTLALCSAFLLMVSALSGCSTSNGKPLISRRLLRPRRDEEKMPM
ncbi:MAG: hypothetical protein ACLSA6_20215 [Holdemania massiliensis]